MEEKISKMLTVIAALLACILLLTAYSAFTANSDTYEYAVLWLPDSTGNLDKLNEAGGQGWEAITMRRANNSEDDTWGYEIWLKRCK